MSNPFTRTLRSLEGDLAAGSILGILSVVTLLGLWSVWFVAARLPVYVTSEEARLEVAGAPRTVAADVSGRIVRVAAEVGQRVAAGQTLFELDSGVERGRLAEEQARQSATSREIESLRRSEATEQQGWARAREVGAAAVAEARSRYEAAVSAAELAEDEAGRNARLYQSGLLPELDVTRARSLARQRHKEAEALRQEEARLLVESGRDLQDRQARVDQIRRDLAGLQGQFGVSAATSGRLREEEKHRVVRAPISGRLAEVARVQPGSVVDAGAQLATILPPGKLQGVATFLPSSSLARIRPGQPARLRLEGFPWTEYGSLDSRVAWVSDEPRQGRVWIVFTLAERSGSTIPLRHGLPGTLEVEVERVSPVALLLRAAGWPRT
ncbi:MAG TPA: HlyD family efflux transporter periplasmic adaptor subunit [Thermoanaerobaculia bacterium]|jgi:membrane fusion protein (multidrug efflux system)